MSHESARTKTLGPDAVRRGLRRVVVVGAALHLLAAACACVAGRGGLLPRVFAPSGVMRGDGEAYLRRCAAPGRAPSELTGGGEQIHVRLYALSCAALAPVFGASVLSLELVNLPLYVLTLFLTFKLGDGCYGARAGLVAAIVVGLFPTLLLHSTQPLRDPLFVVLMLTLLLITITLLTKRLSAARATTDAACGAATLALLWLVRDSLWTLYAGTVAIALAGLVVASLRGRRVWAANLVCMTVVLAAAVVVPKIFSPWLPPKESMSEAQERALQRFTEEQQGAGLSGFPLKLNVARQKFVVLYPEAGSNIDAEKHFGSMSDVLTYLPRAAAIGLFAPFPAQWLEEGRMYGRAGRIIAGVETCCVYVLTLFAAAGAWRARREPQTWVLASVVVVGAAALGLVIVNLGALYRLRYTLVILLIILGAERLSRSLGFKPLEFFVARTREQSA